MNECFVALGQRHKNKWKKWDGAGMAGQQYNHWKQIHVQSAPFEGNSNSWQFIGQLFFLLPLPLLLLSLWSSTAVLSSLITSLFYRHPSPATPILFVQDGRGLCILSLEPSVRSSLPLQITNATSIETFLLALSRISSTSNNLTSSILDWFATFFFFVSLYVWVHIHVCVRACVYLCVWMYAGVSVYI